MVAAGATTLLCLRKNVLGEVRIKETSERCTWNRAVGGDDRMQDSGVRVLR